LPTGQVESLYNIFDHFLLKKLNDFQMGSLEYVDTEQATWTLRGRCRKKVFEMQLPPHENTLGAGTHTSGSFVYMHTRRKLHYLYMCASIECIYCEMTRASTPMNTSACLTEALYPLTMWHPLNKWPDDKVHRNVWVHPNGQHISCGF